MEMVLSLYFKPIIRQDNVIVFGKIRIKLEQAIQKIVSLAFLPISQGKNLDFLPKVGILNIVKSI